MTDPGILSQGFVLFGLLEPREFALFGPHWNRLEALAQVGALDGRILGYAMRPSGVDLAGWCQSHRIVPIAPSGVNAVSATRA